MVLLPLAVSMRVVFSPNGTHPFDMGDFRVLAPARLTAAISAALVTLWEFVASHQPRFGHTKLRLRIQCGIFSVLSCFAKKGTIFSREARKCAGEDKAYLRFMRHK